MSYKDITCVPIKTVGGAVVTVATSTGTLFCGFALDGSAGGCTLYIKNGTTAIITTSAAANTFIVVPLNIPVACSSGIVGSCSGTGSYTLFVAK